MPPALDAEHMGPCRKGPSAEDPAAEVTAFLDEVERVTGERPIIYTNRRFHDAFLKGRLEGERFWIRSIGTPPRFRARDWVIWQIDDQSRRPGVQGPVDLNVFRGSKRAFAAFVSGPARAAGHPPDARRDP
jgi:lysozyme